MKNFIDTDKIIRWFQDCALVHLKSLSITKMKAVVSESGKHFWINLFRIIIKGFFAQVRCTSKSKLLPV